MVVKETTEFSRLNVDPDCRLTTTSLLLLPILTNPLLFSFHGSDFNGAHGGLIPGKRGSRHQEEQAEDQP
jgi:hypothetical protein